MASLGSGICDARWMLEKQQTTELLFSPDQSTPVVHLLAEDGWWTAATGCLTPGRYAGDSCCCCCSAQFLRCRCMLSMASQHTMAPADTQQQRGQ
jgi:hypothetical protein